MCFQNLAKTMAPTKHFPWLPECFFQKYDIFSIKNVKINEILLFYVVNSVFYAKLMVLDIPVNVFCNSRVKIVPFFVKLTFCWVIWMNLDKFGWDWTCLDKFRQIWMNLDKFGKILSKWSKFVRKKFSPFFAPKSMIY